METFDTVFRAFWTYAGPFLLLWWCVEWTRVRPRTAKSVFLSVISAVFAAYGLGRLLWLFIDGQG